MPRNRFFLWATLAMLASVVLAFSPTYYFRMFTGAPDISGTPNLPWHLHVHGFVMTAWFLLPVVQTALVAKGRTNLHRSVGIAGAGLALAVIAMSVFTVVRSVPRLKAAPDSPFTGQDINGLVIGDLVTITVIFPLMLGFGLLRKNRPDVHRRWMYLSSIVMWGPVMGRFLGVWQVPLFAIALSPLTWIIALVVHDFRTLRSLHPATLWAGGVGIAGSVLGNQLSRTSLAADFVDRLSRQ